MRISYPSSLALVLVPCLAGCASQKFKVFVDPAHVAVQSVSIDGRTANVQYMAMDNLPSCEAPINLAEGSATNVTVSVETKGGVKRTQTFSVTKEGETGTITIPAEVAGRVANSGDGLSVELDGKPLPVQGGSFSQEFEAKETRRDLLLVARNADNVRDEVRVNLEAGIRHEVVFDLQLRPKLAAKNANVRFDEEVLFSAEGSNPRIIDEYIWDFGDGSPTQTTKVPSATHRYSFEPKLKTQDSYQASVRIVCGKQTSDPASLEISATLGQETMAIEVQRYPTQDALMPGQPVQFLLTPKDGFFPLDIDKVSVSFGEGQAVSVDGEGKPLSIIKKDGQWKPIVVSHTFTQPGLYNLTVSYSHKTKGLEGPYQAKIGSPQLMVVEPILTEAELVDKAWDNLYTKLAKSLQDTQIPVDSPFALTALDDANFSTASEDGKAVLRLTNLMVAKGHKVLERSTPVLARLAPESVVDIRAELNGKPADDKKSNYRANLDYGIKASSQVGNPIHYSVSLEGTADWMTRMEKRARGSSEGDSNVVQMPGNREVSEADKRWEAFALDTFQKMPLLVARFDTATHLIAVKKQNEGTEVSPNAVFNETFGCPMQLRTAYVQLHVRILDRSGRILKSTTLLGTAAQRELQGQRVADDPKTAAQAQPSPQVLAGSASGQTNNQPAPAGSRMLGITIQEDGTIADVIAGGLAANAGLRTDDQIVKVDGVSISSRNTLRKALDAGAARKAITVRRAGEEVSVSVKFER